MSEHIEDEGRAEGESLEPGWIKSDEEPPKSKAPWVLSTIAGVAMLLVLAAILVPNFIRARARGSLTACKSNLKNIADAMEMYSTDYMGKYPARMDLLTPNYLKTIPKCPQNGTNAYKMWVGVDAPMRPAGYKDYYYICCVKGHTRVDVGPGYPAYDAVIGLVERPPGP